MRRVNCA
jgi:AraC-like DNA-binding protein